MRLIDGPVYQNEALVANANLISRSEASGAGEAGAIEVGAIFRGDIVDFAAVAMMHQDGTMPARGEGILENHIVLRRTPDRVQTDVKRVGTLLQVDEPEIVFGGRRGVGKNDGAAGIGRRRWAFLASFQEAGLIPAGVEQDLSGAAEILPPRHGKMHAVETRITHDEPTHEIARKRHRSSPIIQFKARQGLCRGGGRGFPLVRKVRRRLNRALRLNQVST